jgi:hypothetical protein
MKLCFFRSSSNIPVDAIEEVADSVGQIFGVDYFIFTGPILSSVEDISVDDLLSVSDRFLEKGDPIVAIVYTRERVEDQAIYGLSSETSRGAWVWWNDKIEQIVVVTIHELGHICETGHCDNELCIMYPIYRDHRGRSIDKLFCERCITVVQNSWVYNRLLQASKDRMAKGGRRSSIIHTPAIKVDQRAQNTPQTGGRIILSETPSPPLPPFPEWPPWPPTQREKEEFIRKVMEYFGYEEDE